MEAFSSDVCCTFSVLVVVCSVSSVLSCGLLCPLAALRVKIQIFHFSFLTQGCILVPVLSYTEIHCFSDESSRHCYCIPILGVIADQSLEGCRSIAYVRCSRENSVRHDCGMN